VLTVEQAQQRILAQVPRLSAEEVALADAYGRVLAADVLSQVDVPPWDNSAMDGYAVRAADLSETGATLRLLEMVGAGSVARQPVVSGTAVGIMTGAPMPAGADAVVMVEHTDGATTGAVTVGRAVVPGVHIRRAGEDVARGATILTAGQVLTPARVGLASSVGHAVLPVTRRPVVAVLSTGDEVVPPGQPLGPGQIWSSNNATLVGLVHAAGAVPLDLGTVPDSLDATVTALRDAVARADAVVSTGGVSVGEYDYVKPAFEALGASMDFWKVLMKPGKPLAFGHAGEVPLFGLPGNPVSCTVNFLQFVRPWLRTALGDPRPFLPVVDAIAGDDFRERPGRARFIRVCLAPDGPRWIAHRTGSQGSGVLTSMARAHGLMAVGVEAAAPRVGDAVRVQVIDPSFLDGQTADFGW